MSLSAIEGIVSTIRFRKEETGFTVLTLIPENQREGIVCAGVFPSVEKGDPLRVYGKWDNNPKYGLQLKCKYFEYFRPVTENGIKTLLASGLFEDIGRVRAEKIVESFGRQTLEILDNDPEKLYDVPGIGKKSCERIIKGWKRQTEFRDMMLFFQNFGFSLTMTQRIHKDLGSNAKSLVSKDPYILARKVRGIGFNRADEIASELGFKRESYRRVRSGIIHVLEEASNQGHVFLPEDELKQTAQERLGVSERIILFTLDEMYKSCLLVNEADAVYLKRFYDAEKECAEIITRIIEKGGQEEGDVSGWLGSYAEEKGWKGAEAQVSAVKTAASSRVMLLTGGPGTGKTATLKVIVEYYKSRRMRIGLTAPTGRAANRMKEISSQDASTIHRLLGFHPSGKGGYRFSRNRENPLMHDVIVCDEVSMVDLNLFHSLLLALKPGTVLVLVGDNNQLPSVGPGDVLSDLIRSGVIPHIHLTEIFRQAKHSKIVTAAHEIISGRVPVFENRDDDNCFFIEREKHSDIISVLKELVMNRIPRKYSADPLRDIQILSPVHSGDIGTASVNRVFQKEFYLSGNHIDSGGYRYFEGDKILQSVNNYDKRVFNGDIGYIESILKDNVVVDYDGVSVKYTRPELKEIVPAHCITVHKSQGCEFDHVIMVLSTSHYIMLKRNILYTGLTRAKTSCIIIGSLRALKICIKNNSVASRYSNLDQRLNTEKPSFNNKCYYKG